MSEVIAVVKEAGAIFSSFPDALHFIAQFFGYLPTWLTPALMFVLVLRIFSIVVHKDPGGCV